MQALPYKPATCWCGEMTFQARDAATLKCCMHGKSINALIDTCIPQYRMQVVTARIDMTGMTQSDLLES